MRLSTPPLALLALTLLAPAAPGCRCSDRAATGSRDGARAGDRPARGPPLRILVFGADEPRLARRGSAASAGRLLAQRFARSLDREPKLVWAEGFEDLLPMLQRGEGDLVAARVTVTDARAERFAFTRPVAFVDEVIVGSVEAATPQKLEDLKGRAVHLPRGSAWVASAKAAGAAVVEIDSGLDDGALLDAVARGELPLTIAESDVLEEELAYRSDLARGVTIATEQALAWAVRKDDAQLLQQANQFIVEHALARATDTRAGGDLAEVRKRGTLRVLTRNNAVTYFLHRGKPLGFEFELATSLAEALDVRLEIVVPPGDEELIVWLEEGRGDVIAAAMTVTPEREKRVAFTTPYLWVDEVLVRRKGATSPTSPEELAGKTVTVRAGTAYVDTLEALRKRGVEVTVEVVVGAETEELIARVANGEIELTVADSHILQAELAWRDDIEAGPVLTPRDAAARDAIGKPAPGAKPIAFAVRKDAPALRARIDEVVRKSYRGTEYNMARRRYFEDERGIAESRGEALRETGALTPFDEILERAAAEFGLDMRLLAAVAYQESRFDPRATSWAGARGLFQMMPDTFASLGGEDPFDPEQSARAAARYLQQLSRRFDPRLPLDVRLRFALASYNAGLGHVQDARDLAKTWPGGALDPDQWFGHVEKTMVKLSDPRVHRRTRYGYCRGEEPVAYVREIQQRYDTYVQATNAR